ncbi:hypothetical protein Pla175_32310 [Pirellulimonas nuda]|uniref:MetA-pathway of phenol degradation n=1 Tax=Pirellulimonas nuda TaxID=2528009 RepID=A0A518DEC6_9BACT|nr:transporter [Pirellulimonas nuda]QDU89835.1 hypothetical protein Pla175_32310 [Pirellulimonas nuda]
MRWVLLLALLGALGPRPAAAQVGEEHIETDRDSFTPSTATAGCGLTIVESAYSFIDNRDVAETHSFPELLVRYGVCDWLELRFGANYEVGGASNSISSSSGSFGDIEEPGIETEANLSYGFKAQITQQQGWRPQSAAIVQASTPTSGRETATHLVATYAWGWQLPNDWLWDTAIRYGDGSEEGDNFARWAPSTVVKVPLTEQWDIHAEYFGIFTDGREAESSTHYFSPGVHYLVTPNLEVGVRTGWGLNDQSANFFSNVGFGWRY